MKKILKILINDDDDINYINKWVFINMKDDNNDYLCACGHKNKICFDIKNIITSEALIIGYRCSRFLPDSKLKETIENNYKDYINAKRRQTYANKTHNGTLKIKKEPILRNKTRGRPIKYKTQEEKTDNYNKRLLKWSIYAREKKNLNEKNII